MAQSCTICTHPQRRAIDAALVADASLRDIAGQFDVSKSAVDRHKAEHLPAHLVKAHEQEDIRQAIDVVRQLKAINQATLGILKEARDMRKHAIALMAIDRVQKQIELQAKLIGQLQQEGTTSIQINTEWLEVRGLLLQVLAPFPEARAAVAQALLEVDHAGS